MKDILNRVVVALLVVVFASMPTFAKVHKATVILKADTKVGDTLVEKGSYEVRFDDQSKEVTVRKKGKVIAKTSAELEPLPRKSRDTAVIVNQEKTESTLSGIIYGGTSHTVVLKQTATQATINK